MLVPMSGQEQVPEAMREGYARQPIYDNGEELRRFADDGTGHCLLCRRAKVLHVGVEPLYCPMSAS